MPFVAVVAPIISLVVGVYSLATGIASGPDEVFISLILIVIPAVISLIAAGSFVTYIYEEEES